MDTGTRLILDHGSNQSQTDDVASDDTSSHADVAPNVVVDLSDALTPRSPLAQEIAALAVIRTAEGKRQGGMKDWAAGRLDVYLINPYLLRFKDGRNARDLSDPDNLAQIDKLARSIAQNNGVKEPMTVTWENNKAEVVSGHLRTLAVLRAIETYGARIVTVPVINDKNSTEAERIASQDIRSGSKPLTPFERAEKCAVLAGAPYNWTNKQIGDALGIHAVYVGQLLRLRQGATPEIKDLVASGAVTQSTVNKVLQQTKGDAEAAYVIMSQGVEAAKTKGRETASRKDMRSTAAPLPAPTVRLTRAALHEVLSRAQIDDRASDTVTVTFTAEDFAKLRLLSGL